MEKKSKAPIYKKWWFWAVIIFVIIIGASTNFTKDRTNNEDNSSETTSTSSEAQGENENAKELSQNDAETYCQDANLLQKYLNLKNVKILDIWGAPTQYNPITGWVDSDGNTIYSLVWHGKNTITNDTIYFNCVVSGQEDNIRLHYLSINDEAVFDIRQSTILDENGKYIFMDEE